MAAPHIPFRLGMRFLHSSKLLALPRHLIRRENGVRRVVRLHDIAIHPPGAGGREVAIRTVVATAHIQRERHPPALALAILAALTASAARATADQSPPHLTAS